VTQDGGSVTQEPPFGRTNHMNHITHNITHYTNLLNMFIIIIIIIIIISGINILVPFLSII
jgi:hypothetical protein